MKLLLKGSMPVKKEWFPYQLVMNDVVNGFVTVDSITGLKSVYYEHENGLKHKIDYDGYDTIELVENDNTLVKKLK